ncbi:MAG: hypothetical protein IJK89_10190 [Clostridia bacterium]|nr:hypothetical protein [Clostridia bacterium]
MDHRTDRKANRRKPIGTLLFLKEPLSLPNIVGAIMIIGSAVASTIKSGI